MACFPHVFDMAQVEMACYHQFMSMSQSIANKLRWEKVPKEERSRRMSELAKLTAIKRRKSKVMNAHIAKMVEARKLSRNKKKACQKSCP